MLLSLPSREHPRHKTEMAVPPPPARSAVPFVLGTVTIDAIGFGIIIPVLPELIETVGRVDLSQATRVGGWLEIAYAAMQFLCGPLVGNLGDRFGRRPVILAAMAAFAIDYVVLALAPSIAWLVAGRIVAGMCGASWGPASAALADITAPEDRARRFGYVSAAFAIGFIAGPAIGGLLGMFGPRAPFWAAAALTTLNFLVGLAFFPETLAPAARRPFAWQRANPLGALRALSAFAGLLPLVLVYFFWCLGSMVYPATWAFYGALKFGWSAWTIGLTLVWTGICMALVQTLLLGRVIAKVGEVRSAVLGMAIALVVFVGYAVAPAAWMVWVILTVSALHSIAQPAITAIMSARAPAESQGELQGFNGSVMALASLLAPLFLNMPLAWATGPGAPFRFTGMAFAIAAAFVAVAILLLVGWHRRHPAVADSA